MKMKILIVSAKAAAIVGGLRAKHFDVIVRPSPFGTMNVITQHSPDVVVIDYDAVAINAVDLAGMVKASFQVPVILFSNVANKLIMAAALVNSGADQYITADDADDLTVWLRALR